MPVYKDKAKTKDGRQYYYSISFVDMYGRQQRIRSKRYSTKKDAEIAEAKKLLELDKVASESLTFNQASYLFLPEKKRQMKIQSYFKLERHIYIAMQSLGEIQISKLNVREWEDFLKDLDNRKLSPNYKNKLIGSVKQLLKFTDKRYNLTSSIPSKFDNYRLGDKKEMKFITESQLKKLLETVDDRVWYNLFVCLFYMGFRIGELNALTFEDVDFDNQTVSINKTITTKIKDDNGNYLITSPKTKSSVRTLPMPQIVSKAFLEMYEYYTKFPNFSLKWYVFGGLNAIPETTIQVNKNKYFKLANLEEIRIHDFRHSTASYLINNGATPLLVSKWLGHTNVAMTLNRYSHLYKSELDDIIKTIDKICT